VSCSAYSNVDSRIRGWVEKGDEALSPIKRYLELFVCILVVSLLASCGSLESPELPFTGSSSFGEGDGSVPSAPPSAGGGNLPTPTPQNGLTAPSVVEPSPGATVSDTTPTLTIRNAVADDGSTPTHEFDVAFDAAFQNLVARAIEIDPDPGNPGTSSWEVSPSLGGGQYFWRARGVGSRGPGPYTPTSSFNVGSGGPGPPPPSGNALISDPLTNGQTVGELGGGRFLSSGWQVTARGDFIRYRIPTIESGFVEWENRGLSSFNPAPDLFSIFGMWDPTRGDYRENPFRVHIRKLDTQGHNPPWVRLRFISNGDQRDVGWDFLAWDPTRFYQWRIEWGPSGSGGNEARVLVDGTVVIRTGYGPAYRPEEHWVELGVEERAESIVGLVYRNVRIGRR
jgi:hypothetical protein